jgi:hypothetical protein
MTPTAGGDESCDYQGRHQIYFFEDDSECIGHRRAKRGAIAPGAMIGRTRPSIFNLHRGISEACTILCGRVDRRDVATQRAARRIRILANVPMYIHRSGKHDRIALGGGSSMILP